MNVPHAPRVEEGVPDGVVVREDDGEEEGLAGYVAGRTELSGRVEGVEGQPGDDEDDDDDGDTPRST